MIRRTVKLLVVGIPLISLVCVAYWKYSGDVRERTQVHDIKKRQTDHRINARIGNVPAEPDETLTLTINEEEISEGQSLTFTVNEKEPNDFEELLPGYLVCKKRKEKSEISPPQKLIAGLEELDKDNELVLRDEERKVPRVRISLSSLSPTRPIGCCPPGDKEGKIYRVGSYCCIDEVYNTTSHFCCLSKARVLEFSKENRDYCYPQNRQPFCRLVDLELKAKKPMTAECQYTSNDTPYSCTMVCPKGMQPKDGIDQVECLENGVWNTLPTCCEGCPSTFRLDVWFLVEVSQLYGMKNFSYLLQFLKDSLSYLPVSQEGVRVGITLFNRVVFHDVGVWYLSDHNSHESLNRAIDEIPIEGSGSKTGAALSWVANNAFTEQKGNREDVENLVVAILEDEADDPYTDAARELKSISKVMVIGIGDKLSDDDMHSIASLPNNVYRAPSFEKLPELNRVVFKSVCGETCILQKN
uniref:transmembrane cell adhesion receptor mua-3-like n=1 Tax=Styela clava TaxID=7725 RepID=UPI00193940A0|nr:transmembrane cell adhesion receptor mua-3-like [Styela clava]